MRPRRPGDCWDLAAFGLVPGAAAFNVERFDRPGRNMERVRAPDRVRGTAGDRLGDPIRHVSGYVGEFGCSLVAEFVEEPLNAASLRPGPAHTRRPVS